MLSPHRGPVLQTFVVLTRCKSHACLPLARVSQRPLINKEDYLKYSIWVADVDRCATFLFRIWQSCCCTCFPDTVGALRILPVLSAARRLPTWHTESSVIQTAKQALTGIMCHCSGISTTHFFLKWTLCLSGCFSVCRGQSAPMTKTYWLK